MAKQQKNAHVPKFGNWDNDGNVPYTLYFDNARKGKGGKPMNPNDPLENPEAFSSSVVAPSPHRSSEQGRSSALPPSSPPPAHHHERRPSDAPPPAPPLSPYHRNAGGEPPRRDPGGGRTGGAGGYSVEPSPAPSPLHPYGQSRAEYSDGSSGYGLVANSVDRSRARGASRGNETPTRGSVVPKFGDWDSNPASADGYTHIFNKVREEKSTQAKAPGFGKDNAAYGNGARQHDDGYVSSSRWCFGWCSK